MNRRAKRFFFRHHWWLVPSVAVPLGLCVLKVNIPDKGTMFAAIVAAAISISFFVQQQRLAEMNLFRELITTFNQRYDQLNGSLQRIRRSGITMSADGQAELDYQAVLDYFNLCAEEYLFFSEGYIDSRVWRSWCNGMLYYIEVEPFNQLWDQAMMHESHYGLTENDIRKGASRDVS
jgi:hypothetical protein